MPNKKSAKKYMRVTERKTLLNIKIKKRMKQAIKKVEDLLREKKIEQAKLAFKETQKAIDKAVKRGLIKKNTGSRKKSRLVKKIKTLVN